MPMPRSFGSFQVTLLPLMKICPSEMSSSPAMQLSRGGLAAAGCTEQDEELAVRDVQIEVLEDLQVAKIQ